MTPEETINGILRRTTDLLLSSSGYTIKAKQLGAPRPTGSYATVDFVAGLDIGTDNKEYSNSGQDDITVSSSGYREVTFSISFYRDEAVDNARTVRKGFRRESVLANFREEGLGLLSTSEVREISESLENGWEEIATFDIVLSVIESDSDTVGSINGAEITAEYQQFY